MVVIRQRPLDVGWWRYQLHLLGVETEIRVGKGDKDNNENRNTRIYGVHRMEHSGTTRTGTSRC